VNTTKLRKIEVLFSYFRSITKIRYLWNITDSKTRILSAAAVMHVSQHKKTSASYLQARLHALASSVRFSSAYCCCCCAASSCFSTINKKQALLQVQEKLNEDTDTALLPSAQRFGRLSRFASFELFSPSMNYCYFRCISNLTYSHRLYNANTSECEKTYTLKDSCYKQQFAHGCHDTERRQSVAMSISASLTFHLV